MKENTMSPLRVVRYALPLSVILIILLIVSFVIPFYSYSYFSISETLNYFECAKISHQLYFPIIGNIIAVIFMIATLVLMILNFKSKVVKFITKLMSLIMGFLFLAFFIIALCRLWVVPYEFTYSAVESLRGGYILYLFDTLFLGFLSCYILALQSN